MWVFAVTALFGDPAKAEAETKIDFFFLDRGSRKQRGIVLSDPVKYLSDSEIDLAATSLTAARAGHDQQCKANASRCPTIPFVLSVCDSESKAAS